MNLNEQLQQAYNAGRQQGLNEQGRLGKLRRSPDLPDKPSGDLPGFNPDKPIGSYVELDYLSWQKFIKQGTPPRWWTGTFEEFESFYRSLIDLISAAESAGIPRHVIMEMTEVIHLLMNAFYNPNNSRYIIQFTNSRLMKHITKNMGYSWAWRETGPNSRGGLSLINDPSGVLPGRGARGSESTRYYDAFAQLLADFFRQHTFPPPPRGSREL